MSGVSDSDESTTAPFLCKAPLSGTTAASSHFQSAGTRCRSSIMHWDMGLAGLPSIMAGGRGGFGPGHIRRGKEKTAPTGQGFFSALNPHVKLTIWHLTTPTMKRTLVKW